ncbi:MAG: hypothetical protein LBD46_07605 [Endomicrobium sp.]|jgi:3-hydroxymyristoyl/3-hydroxydecanoyl-(acyl carrier protein) dehydratase|nr:hypothetical protein [Endomicrobium sp.]
MENVKKDIEHSFKGREGSNFIFEIKEDFIAFKGHFPQIALLPGVVQIEIALFCAKKLLNDDTLELSEVIKGKFVKPVRPGTKLFVFAESEGNKFKISIKDKNELYSQIQFTVEPHAI